MDSVLMQVCMSGNIEELKYICDYYDRFNKDITIVLHGNDEYLLRILCINNKLDIIKFLFEYEEERGRLFNLYTQKGIVFSCCHDFNIILYIIHKIRNHYDNICTYSNINKHLCMNTTIIYDNIDKLFVAKNISNSANYITNILRCLIYNNNIYEHIECINDMNYIFMLKM